VKRLWLSNPPPAFLKVATYGDADPGQLGPQTCNCTAPVEQFEFTTFPSMALVISTKLPVCRAMVSDFALLLSPLVDTVICC
jgi:hypothetical protein